MHFANGFPGNIDVKSGAFYSRGWELLCGSTKIWGSPGEDGQGLRWETVFCHDKSVNTHKICEALHTRLFKEDRFTSVNTKKLPWNKMYVPTGQL